MYNLYDEENMNYEEQLYYYIDEEENTDEQQENDDITDTELTVDYLYSQEKLPMNEKEDILFTDKVKNKTYQGKVIGHSKNNDGKFLFSVTEIGSDTSVNKVFSASNISRVFDLIS